MSFSKSLLCLTPLLLFPLSSLHSPLSTIVSTQLALALSPYSQHLQATNTPQVCDYMSPEWVENQSLIPVVGPPAANGLAEDSPDATTQKQHQETQATYSDRLRRCIEEKEKIPVTFRKSDSRPIEKYASTFMTKLGVAVKKFAPLQVSD